MDSPGMQPGRHGGTELCLLLAPLQLILPDHLTHFVGPKEPKSTLE